MPYTCIYIEYMKIVNAEEHQPPAIATSFVDSGDCYGLILRSLLLIRNKLGASRVLMLSVDGVSFLKQQPTPGTQHMYLSIQNYTSTIMK